MKLNKSLLYIAAVAFSLSACDDNQPWNETEVTKTGKLVLDVDAKAPEKTRTSVSTDGFTVNIKGKDEALKNYNKSFTYGTDLTPSTVLEMPVGNYEVSVCSFPSGCPKQYLYPVYGATKDIQIDNTATTQTTVNCKMENSRISVKYSDEFISKFTEWEITINDGGSKALTYNQENTSPRDIYWLFEENTTTVTVDIKATTTDGVSIEAQAAYTKRNSTEQYTDIDSEYFGGGDALEISFNPATNNFGTVTGITITTNILFTNEDQDIVVEVIDDGSTNSGDNSGDNPDDNPGGDEIVVNFTYGAEFTVNYGQTNDYPDVQVDFTFPTGLQNLFVKVSGSDDFVFACGLMGLTEGDGLDLASDAAQELKNLFNLPVVGDNNYQFSLNDTLWGLLTNSPGYPGTQTFTLKAVDQNGMTKSGELTLHINE